MSNEVTACLMFFEFAVPQCGRFFPPTSFIKSILMKGNIAPERLWLEDYVPFGMVTLQGAMLNLGGCMNEGFSIMNLLVC